MAVIITNKSGILQAVIKAFLVVLTAFLWIVPSHSFSMNLPPQNIKLVTDLAIAGVFGFCTDPFIEILYNQTVASNILKETPTHVDFSATLLYGAADSVQSAARVYGAMIVAHFAATSFLELDSNWDQVAPKITGIVWLALTTSTFKRTLFRQAVAGQRLGRVSLYDRLLDVIIWAVTCALILDILEIDVGMGLQSVFAAGGVGALLFSLASKGLAEQIIGGITIRAWDAFAVGDDIKLGDGTEGTVIKIGLVETEIRGYDNVPLRISNSQLTQQRVSNMSKIERSRVRQELRFKYADIKKVPKVLQDIKREILDSCPKLIKDGSKPFRAVLTSYEADHIHTMVDCHFDIPPLCGEFVENREQVLLAIARAMEQNQVEFALPSIFYQTDGDAIAMRKNVLLEE